MLKISKVLALVLAVAAVLCIAAAVHAQAPNYRWTGGGGSSDWHDPDNWIDLNEGLLTYPGQVLPLGYQHMENPLLPPPTNPVVISTVLPERAFTGHVNFYGSDTLAGGTIKVVTGGAINMGTDIFVGRQNHTGVIIMEGGVLDAAGKLAFEGSKGRIEMTGGTVNWGNLTIGNSAITDALINLHGGQFNLNSYSTNPVAGIQEVIDIQNGGLLALAGNQEAFVVGMAGGTETTGLIRGSNGVARPDLEALGTVGSSGDLRWVFDGNGNETFVWATGSGGPPPATVEFTDSNQLNLAGREVLAAVNFYDPNRTGDGQRTAGVIQGVEFDDFRSNVDDTGSPIALLAGAGGTLSTVIVQTPGREFGNDPTLLNFSGPDATEAENLANGGMYMQNPGFDGTTTTLSLAFGGSYANTDVEVQMVGGGVWARTDRVGNLVAWVDGDEKGALQDRGTPDLLTFSATTDALGNLVIDMVNTVAPGDAGNRQYVILSGFSVTAAGDAAAIPEPSTFALAALGLLGLGFVARRRRKN